MFSLTQPPLKCPNVGNLQLILGLLLGWLIQELAETLDSSVSVVVNDLICALLEEFDGGEALDLDLLQLVGSGVHLGNDNVLVIGILLSQLVPDGYKLLAVSAPDGKEER